MDLMDNPSYVDRFKAQTLRGILAQNAVNDGLVTKISKLHGFKLNDYLPTDVEIIGAMAHLPQCHHKVRAEGIFTSCMECECEAISETIFGKLAMLIGVPFETGVEACRDLIKKGIDK